jgi:hypothetical protein
MLRVRVGVRVRVRVRVRKATRIMKSIIDIQTTVDWLVVNNTGIILSYCTNRTTSRQGACTSRTKVRVKVRGKD